jgi:FkbM family methyltransferase
VALTVSLAACGDRPAQAPAAPLQATTQQPAPRRDLLSTEKPHYSHANEEVLIRDFFQDRRDGFFLDVGCAHPIFDSNTYYLEEELGWSGIGVDALPELAPKWRRRRPRSLFFNYIVTDHSDTVDPFFRAEPRVSGISSIERPVKGPGGDPVGTEEIRVPTTTLTGLLERNKIAKVDFLSMDIEGAEPLALAGFDIERFKPALACVEAKVKTRGAILGYFAARGYQRIDRYLAYDATNYYFTPRGKD